VADRRIRERASEPGSAVEYAGPASGPTVTIEPIMQRTLPMQPHPKLKKLRFIKGAWTAGGHSFNDAMRCSSCRRSWVRQQESPTYCRKALETLPRRKRTRAA
jgi:hypothetical protein